MSRSKEGESEGERERRMHDAHRKHWEEEVPSLLALQVRSLLALLALCFLALLVRFFTCSASTLFTCFASTKVQIRTLKAPHEPEREDDADTE
jgi:hypothetical protein